MPWREACPNQISRSGLIARNRAREYSPCPTMLSSANRIISAGLAAISSTTDSGERATYSRFWPSGFVLNVQNVHLYGQPREPRTVSNCMGSNRTPRNVG